MDGALFFNINNKNSIISDINKELIISYNVIKDNVELLIESLKYHKNSPEYFYKIRSLDIHNLIDVEIASRFIYLNKTCFNGLYRVNKKGQFNAPFGKYENPKICDEDNLREISILLNNTNTSILNNSFIDIENKITENDFVYFDPPYYSTFDGYSQMGFSLKDQEELASLFLRLSKKCYVMLSNSNFPYIKELYKDFNIIEIEAGRSINCKGDGRAKTKCEVLIKNY